MKTERFGCVSIQELTKIMSPKTFNFTSSKHPFLILSNNILYTSPSTGHSCILIIGSYLREIRNLIDIYSRVILVQDCVYTCGIASTQVRYNYHFDRHYVFHLILGWQTNAIKGICEMKEKVSELTYVPLMLHIWMEGYVRN